MLRRNILKLWGSRGPVHRRARPGAAVGPAAQRCNGARLRGGVDVAGEPGALAAALEHDLAVMKVRELGAMGDADDARMLELVRQKHHQSILAGGLARGGRLVEP